ncbi:MAG: S41 family peptidase [Alistipes sp.]|nr:S41 family peptidase [Alistipes sp.]
MQVTKKRYITTIAVALIALVAALVGYIGGVNKGKAIFKQELSQQTEKIHSLEETLGLSNGMMQNMVLGNKLLQTCLMLERNYIEPISLDSLSERVIPLLIQELDPHSTYIPKQEVEAYNEPLEAEFDGIGVVFNASTDTVTVLNVVRKGPSEKAGIKAGDRILEVNDTVISGVKMPQERIMKNLRGKRGTVARLKVKRQQVEEPMFFDVIRDAIPLESVGSAFMIDSKAQIGFIHLSQFSMSSYREVKRAIDELRGQGAKKLIIDLRSNSGGFLDQAILIANEFLPKDKLIVYTTGRDEEEQLRQYSDGRGSATDMQVVILLDEQSASASEIVAGALQDNDQGTIIGRRSFGKGLVQEQVMYNDGSALRLTVAKYHTPTGRCIQRPFERGNNLEYHLDILHRYENNEFFTLDSLHFADSLRYTTPKGRVVYGGGGIVPDKFVPLDTTYVSDYFTEVSVRNILYQYTLDYTDRHRQELDQITTISEMEQFFKADKQLISNFYTYAARKGVAPKTSDIAKSKAVIEAQIKAYIARNTQLEDDAFYYFIAPIDDTLQAALKELR